MSPNLVSAGSYLNSAPPILSSLVARDLNALYRQDSKYVANPEQDQALREVYQNFLSGMLARSPRDQNNPTIQQIHTGFGFARTNADHISGLAVSLVNQNTYQSVVYALVCQHKHLQLMTHPSILESRIKMITDGSSGRIQRTGIAAFEEALEKQVAISWEDLGWAINERDYDREIPNGSTSYIRAQGMWSHHSHSSSNPLVASIVMGPSHPDLVSALSLAELALSGSIVFVPCDGTQRDFAAQKAMLAAAREIIAEHPILTAHEYRSHVLTNGEKLSDHLKQEAIKRIGITLKPYPVQESIDFAKECYDELGVQIFRCFDPRDTHDLPKVIQGVRASCEKAHIYASQITGVSSAHKMYECGANAVIMNIGDGGHCKTASGTGMSTSNPVNFYRVQRDAPCELGIILDGGVGPQLGLSLSLGSSACMKHGSLLGGTLQQIPCFGGVVNPKDGRFYKLHSGEAAARTKILGGQVDVAGLPKNVEGVDGAAVVLFDPENLSALLKLERMLEAVAKYAAFQQARSLSEILNWKDPIVMKPTASAKWMAAPHV